MRSVSDELRAASDGFYSALTAVLGGDPEPMFEVWSHADDATFMSPFGELLVGWDAIRASWEAQASRGLGGEVHPEDLHLFASDSLGCVIGFERGSITVDGQPTALDIRATSVYRLEDGAWKMVGHHTDPLG